MDVVLASGEDVRRCSDMSNNADSLLKVYVNESGAFVILAAHLQLAAGGLKARAERGRNRHRLATDAWRAIAGFFMNIRTSRHEIRSDETNHYIGIEFKARPRRRRTSESHFYFIYTQLLTTTTSTRSDLRTASRDILQGYRARYRTCSDHKE